LLRALGVWILNFGWVADPGRQFDLVAQHINSIQRQPGFGDSRFIIYVERNLGFEAGKSPSLSFCGCHEVGFELVEQPGNDLNE